MDYIGAIETALGKKAEMEMLSLQIGDVPDAYAEVTHFFEHFCYKPTASAEVGVANFVEWCGDCFTELFKRGCTILN